MKTLHKGVETLDLESNLCMTTSRLLFHHQASVSGCIPVQICIGEFPKQCESKEFPREIRDSSYTLENNFTDARLGGEILNSDVSMYDAHAYMAQW